MGDTLRSAIEFSVDVDEFSFRGAAGTSYAIGFQSEVAAPAGELAFSTNGQRAFVAPGTTSNAITRYSAEILGESSPIRVSVAIHRCDRSRPA